MGHMEGVNFTEFGCFSIKVKVCMDAHAVDCARYPNALQGQAYSTNTNIWNQIHTSNHSCTWKTGGIQTCVVETLLIANLLQWFVVFIFIVKL